MRAQFYDQAIARVKDVPGVRAVAATTVLPFGGGWSTGSFEIEGYTPGPNQPGPWGDQRLVNPDFFQAMDIPLVQGRTFTTEDNLGAPPVAIVDAEFVRRYSKDQNPIGRRITFGAAPGQKPTYITIVGVVGHTMHEGLDADARLQMYMPYAQNTFLNQMGFAVRTTGDPMHASSAIREAIRGVDRDMPISGVNTMDALIERSLGQRRLSMILLGARSRSSPSRSRRSGSTAS